MVDYYPGREEFGRLTKKGNLIPVYREILADMETPVSAFRKIAGTGYAYLLESVEGGEKLGRYSFLGSVPELIFKSKGRKAEISRGRKKRTLVVKSDPLQALKEVMSRYKPVVLKGLPRFPGGAVGYIGYDMVRFFEKLPQKNIDDLNLPDCIFVFSSCLVIFDHTKHTIKVVSNAFLENNALSTRRQVDQAYELAKEKIDKIIDRLKKPVRTIFRPGGEKDKAKLKSNFTRPDFIKGVKKAKDYIRAGDVIQVVLSQRWEKKTKAAPFDFYRALRSVNPSPYMYFLKFGDLKIVGSSPEILVRAEEGKITLRPIAGTRPRGEDEEGDETLRKELLADSKERAEHIMLVDLGRNDVGRVCHYGSVGVDELMTVEKYSHVMHIVSNVVGKLRRGKNQFDVLRACFPAGTVTGAPKVRAMEIIEELEPTVRGPYAGAVGYFSFSGNLDSCITIRTIIVKSDTAYVQAGAGIVADSQPEREYEETKNKAQALLKAMEMAEQGLDC